MLADEIFRQLPPGARLELGTVVEVDVTAGTVTVNVGGVDHGDRMSVSPGWWPAQGDGVLVARQGQNLYILGSVYRPLPPFGTVVSTAATTVGVSVPGVGEVSLPFAVSYTPRTVGDVVAIVWGGSPGSGYVVGELSTSPSSPTLPAPAPPPPPPSPTTGTTTFTARSAGTYRSGEWRTDANGDVIQGSAPGYSGDNEGAWFYHGAPKSTLVGAKVTKAEIWLGRTSGGVYAAQACHLYRVTNNSRPAGALTFGSGPHDALLAVGQTGWFTLSTTIAQQIVDSGGSVGIKAPSGPYMRMFGLSKSGSAGALRITWRR